MEQRWKEDFDRDGFIVLERLFPAEEVKAMKEEIGRVLAGLEEGEGKRGFANAGVYVGLALKSGFFRKLAADARLAAPLKAVIGDRVLFISDKVVAKNAALDFASPWHQDWPYWEGSHKISVWIALDDAVPENGCLKMIPGSHKSTVRHADFRNSSHGFGNRLLPEHIDESKAVTVAAVAGTAILFHDLTIHSSYPNVSGQDRWALISTYKNAAEPDPDYPWQNPIPL